MSDKIDKKAKPTQPAPQDNSTMVWDLTGNSDSPFNYLWGNSMAGVQDIGGIQFLGFVTVRIAEKNAKGETVYRDVRMSYLEAAMYAEKMKQQKKQAGGGETLAAGAAAGIKQPKVNDSPLIPEKQKFYPQFATPLVERISTVSAANKYKALYMVAQKRVESGMNITNYKGNIYNMTGSGDKGSVPITAPEFIKGKWVQVTQNYAVFSSKEAASEGYFKFIGEKTRYAEAWKALTTDTKNFSDFAEGLKKGGYATAPNYVEQLQILFKEVVHDYERLLRSEIKANLNQIKAYQEFMQAKVVTATGIKSAKDSIDILQKENDNLGSELKTLLEFKKNESIDQ